MRFANIPPPLSAGMSPCRSTRETLHNSVGVLPGSKVVVEAGPLDQQLLDGVGSTLMKSGLQHALRDLHVVVEVEEPSGDC